MLFWVILIPLLIAWYIFSGMIFLRSIDIDQTISNWCNDAYCGRYWFSIVAWPFLFIIYLFHYIKAKYE